MTTRARRLFGGFGKRRSTLDAAPEIISETDAKQGDRRMITTWVLVISMMLTVICFIGAWWAELIVAP